MESGGLKISRKKTEKDHTTRKKHGGGMRKCRRLSKKETEVQTIPEIQM